MQNLNKIDDLMVSNLKKVLRFVLELPFMQLNKGDLLTQVHYVVAHLYPSVA